MFRITLFVLLFAAACATAPAEPADNDAKVRVAPRPGWAPPEPNPKDFDWIKLDTGEWLKGELKSLRSRDFEFESDKLDTLTFKWADVHEIRSSKQNTVVLTNNDVVTGTLLIKGGVVAMRTADGDQQFKRADVLSIIPAAGERRAAWTGKVSLGLSVRAGNTDQVDTNAQIFVRRRSPFSRIDFNYLGNYSALDGSVSVDNHRLSGQWDYFLSQRWYLTPIAVEAYRDRFQNIESQVTPKVGVGYRVIDTADLELEIDIAGGWRSTEFVSVTPGQPTSENTGTIVPGLTLEWDITKDVELNFSYYAEIGVPDTANTNQHLLLKIEVDLFKDLDLDVTFQWDRIGDPRAAADGSVPLKDDFRTIVGFGWDF